MTAPAPCRFCGATDTDHICLFCGVCNAYTRHEKRGRRWRCVPCDERCKALGVHHVGQGVFAMRRLNLGVYGPPKRPDDGVKLEDIFS
jgi:hypothetical protein